MIRHLNFKRMQYILELRRIVQEKKIAKITFRLATWLALYHYTLIYLFHKQTMYIVYNYLELSVYYTDGDYIIYYLWLYILYNNLSA